MRGRGLFALLVALVVAAPAFAQVQTVGDVSFAVPPGWQYQAATGGGAMFLKQGQNFWIISVHAPLPSSGDPNADFKAAWRSTVLPVPDFQNSLPGYTPYDIGKTLGYPGKEYSANSDSGKSYVFLYTLTAGKSVIPVMVISQNRQVLDLMDHTVKSVVGSVRLAPLKASPIRNTITMADLAGEWRSGLAFSKTYYDRYTGAYAGSTQTFYGASYWISANGSFTYKLAGMMNSQVTRDEDSGTIELGGEFVTFKGRNRTTRYRFLDLQTAIDGSTVITLLSAENKDLIVHDSDRWSRLPQSDAKK